MSTTTKRNLLLIICLLSLVCISYIVVQLAGAYKLFYKDNVAKNTILYIPTNAPFESVMDSLRVREALVDEASFMRAAKKGEYLNKFRPGRYRLQQGMNNEKLLRMFKVGQQEPVNLVIAGHIRSNEKLAGVLSRRIEPDSLTMLRALSTDSIVAHVGRTPATIMEMIIPNTYEVYWSITPEKLLQRLYKEYNAFWNPQRLALLDSIGMTREETVTLASIVNEETNMESEMPRIAGVYINRLSIGMPLQADPTLKYAWNDFSLKRILDKHKAIDSPYNTYKHTGLPPGPICVPSIAAIDAVLHYEHSEYLYFCANDDFSGYHVFSKSLSQHLQNASKYWKALNKLHIYQ